ncbi:class I SAM-dependent methyltransferase [Spirosoma utsteinense]|uniref:SAM-dependent methyltransferase n=1 Tax=Spirosoma utsteinense TaxID=2585773 RepID=A0ABR6W1S7_9BACT|nr:class I SAM-dependent methyltransferase [Spirosoma utsteinense]MBC3786491.1 SAM-dependent methyltransferase [Spirosoma utsteinense]MBC3789867.1 SAM-dependent methyltransferase [Spirosoma utsteinense]
MNPWSLVPYADYERHMSHESVGQLASLSEITKEKVEQRYPQTVAVYGACTGNGFAHFVEARTVYAVDLNPTYLAVLYERYEPILNELILLQADVTTDAVAIPPDSVDLVICHLFLEYVDLERTFASIRQTLRPGGLLNIVLQRSNDTGWVSNTGVTTLQPVAAIANEVSEETLLRHAAPDLRFEGRQTYRMPNGKSLISYDFVKMGINQPDEESLDFEWPEW